MAKEETSIAPMPIPCKMSETMQTPKMVCMGKKGAGPKKRKPIKMAQAPKKLMIVGCAHLSQRTPNIGAESA